jgi:hypothetical protein
MNEDAVTITSVVDPMWIEFCTRDTDLFLRTYCGYWLRGVERDDALGWLVWEDDEKCAMGKEPNRAKAVAAWRAGSALPDHWFRLNVDAAKRAWVEGVKWRGEKWYEDGDANAYDYVLQQALFGEQRYA